MTDSHYAAAQVAASPRMPRTPMLVIALSIVAIGILAAGFLFQAINAGRTARDQAVTSTQTIAVLSAALGAGIDAETGQRGYLLTNAVEYLEPFNRAVTAWPAALDELEALIATDGEPDHLTHVQKLRGLSIAKMDEITESLRLYETGETRALLTLVQSSVGKRVMDEYREVSDELKTIKTQALNESLDRAKRVEARNLPLLLALIFLILSLVTILFWFERKAARAAVALQEAEAMRRARDLADLTSRELNHRVKNLFAVITSMVRLASREKGDPQSAFKTLRDRIHALSIAHAVTRGDVDRPVAELGELMRATLAPYQAEGRQIACAGPTARIEAKSVTPLGLILHELATNAVKYGALSTDQGRLDVSWTRSGDADDRRVRLVWSETGPGGLTAPDIEGFGLTMMSASVHQVGGEIEREWRDNGLEAVLTFPVMELRT